MADSMSNKMNTELGLLPKLISLPKQPNTVLWQLEEAPGRDSGSLTALLSFKETDYQYIVDHSPKTEANTNQIMPPEFYKKWVPESLRNTIKTSVNGDSLELLNIKSLQAELFTQSELSPYKNGSVTPLGNGFILVSLYSM